MQAVTRAFALEGIEMTAGGIEAVDAFNTGYTTLLSVVKWALPNAAGLKKFLVINGAKTCDEMTVRTFISH